MPDTAPLARPDPGVLDGIDARLRGHVKTSPRSRFTQTGEVIWEFDLEVVDSFLPLAEKVVCRLADERYGTVQSWVVPGRHIYARGVLHLLRWEGKGGLPRARLLLETINLMPLDQKRPPDKAELDLSPPQRQLMSEAQVIGQIPHIDGTTRHDRMQQMLDELK